MPEAFGCCGRNGPQQCWKHCAALTAMQGFCTMADKREITPELLRQLLDYDPETGALYYRPRNPEHFDCKNPAHGDGMCRAWNRDFAHKRADSLVGTNNGYPLVRLFNKRYVAHRIAWTIYYGEPPKSQIDHISGVRSDNRIGNLRSVSPTENSRNMARQSRNKTGFSGVTWCETRKKWRATISDGSRLISIGRYDTFHDAVVARQAAEKVLGFHPNHGRDGNQPNRYRRHSRSIQPQPAP